MNVVYLLFGLFIAQSGMMLAAYINEPVNKLWLLWNTGDLPCSSLLILPVIFLLFWVLPAGLGYWLCLGDPGKPILLGPSAGIAVMAIVCSCFGVNCPVDGLRYASWVVAAVCWMSFVYMILYVIQGIRRKLKDPNSDFWGGLRSSFTGTFWLGCLLLLATLAWALADWFGQKFVEDKWWNFFPNTMSPA